MNDQTIPSNVGYDLPPLPTVSSPSYNDPSYAGNVIQPQHVEMPTLIGVKGPETLVAAELKDKSMLAMDKQTYKIGTAYILGAGVATMHAAYVAAQKTRGAPRKLQINSFLNIAGRQTGKIGSLVGGYAVYYGCIPWVLGHLMMTQRVQSILPFHYDNNNYQDKRSLQAVTYYALATRMAFQHGGRQGVPRASIIVGISYPLGLLLFSEQGSKLLRGKVQNVAYKVRSKWEGFFRTEGMTIERRSSRGGGH